MIRFGSPSSDTREMNLEDIFFSRLKLMIIMAKAYLGGCPLGERRRKAMYENASQVENEAMTLKDLVARFPGGSDNGNPSAFDYIFHQRVKLLAVMVKAAAKGFPLGEHRRSAMQENLDIVCQVLLFDSRPETISFLKVA